MVCVFVVLLLVGACGCVPVRREDFLDLFYEGGGNEVEGMQGDQPAGAVDNQVDRRIKTGNSTRGSLQEQDYLKTMRSREKDSEDDRAKDMWKEQILLNILRQVGRVNSTLQNKVNLDTINITKVMHNFQNDTGRNRPIDDHFFTEKIRSFYPSCDTPKNTDQEIWKEENEMNLFFDFEQMQGTIASATLRLYRSAFQNSTGQTDPSSCENGLNEEDKLYRVSIFFYTKIKKHRVKRRLCDSKVISEQSKWVELNVRPAARSWAKGKNLGLAVLVEDQDGGVLRAEAFFKGAACMVGSSTPKPIPTVLLDSARSSNELVGINGPAGGNSTSTLHFGPTMLPTIDICTLEVAENHSGVPDFACNLRRLHEDDLRAQQRERAERVASLPRLTLPSTRHIRHQKQHLAEKKRQMDEDSDPRSRMTQQKVIMTSEQLSNYNLEGLNFTNVKR